MDGVPPPTRMMQLISGYWLSQVVYAAAKLNLADLVLAGIRTPEHLAEQTGMHAPSLYRLLRALASVGVFAEEADGSFLLTPLAECLLDRPGSQKAVAIMNGEEHYFAWGEILHALRTGTPGFDHRYGQPIFDWLSEHPEQAKLFDAAMSGIHGAETAAMLEAYDFTGIGTLVDVGGGNGSLLLETLRCNAQLRGIIFDLPGVTARTRENIARAGLADRCSVAAGNFFEGVVAGGDAYLLRHILHDWTDAQCKVILDHIRRVIPADGRLLVVESVIPPGNEPSFGKLLDLNMLLLPGGKERTEAEYRRLFAASGFRLDRIVPTGLEPSVIEARPA